MLLNPNREDRLNRLKEQLRLAAALTTTLISNVTADACVRLPAQAIGGPLDISGPVVVVPVQGSADGLWAPAPVLQQLLTAGPWIA
jgi:hypothetical protein